MAEDRSTLSEIAVSALMVAALSLSGKCFIWALRQGRTMSLQLPSARSEKVLVSGNTLVIVFRPESTVEGARVQLITWTLDGTSTKSFFANVPTQDPQKPSIRFLLDECGATILLLERVPVLGSLSSKNEFVRSTRFDLAGVVRAQSSSVHYPCSDDLWNDVDVDVGFPAQANHSAAIWSVSPRISRFRSGHLDCRCIRYDFQRDKVSLDQYRYSVPIPYTDERTCLYCWKDIAYYWNVNDFNPELHVIDLQESTCTRAHIATIPWPTSFSSRLFGRFARNDLEWGSCLRGDELFHIRAFNVGFVICCFDKHFKVGNESAEYKDARKSRRKARAHMNKTLSALDDSATPS